MTRRPRVPMSFYIEGAAPAPGAKGTVLQPPPLDVVEEGDGWRLVFEIPGAVPGSLSIETKGRIVTVRGDRLPTCGEPGRFLRVERAVGPFERALELPEEPDADAARASYRDGLLVVELPRRQRSGGRSIPVRRPDRQR